VITPFEFAAYLDPVTFPAPVMLVYSGLVCPPSLERIKAGIVTGAVMLRMGSLLGPEVLFNNVPFV
jgi:hypothetical protein